MQNEPELTEREKDIQAALAMRMAVMMDVDRPQQERRGVRLVDVCRPVIRLQGGSARGVGPFCVAYTYGGTPIVLAGDAVNTGKTENG